MKAKTNKSRASAKSRSLGQKKRTSRNRKGNPKSKPKSYKPKVVTYVFTEEDYNNDNGILTSVWGPSLWHTLHCISVNYPLNPSTDDKRHYKNFIMSLRYVLPCGKCRENLTDNLKLHPLTATALKSRENFSKWMYELHEVVNTALKKRSGLTFRDVQDRYEHFRARCGHKNSSVPSRVQSGGGVARNAEYGCVNSVYGIKAKCQIHIVPQSTKGCSLMIDKKCVGHSSA
jgi:hypothetical protein